MASLQSTYLYNLNLYNYQEKAMERILKYHLLPEDLSKQHLFNLCLRLMKFFGMSAHAANGALMQGPTSKLPNFCLQGHRQGDQDGRLLHLGPCRLAAPGVSTIPRMVLGLAPR